MAEVTIRGALPRDEPALAELDWLTWAPYHSVMPRPSRDAYFYDRFHLPEHFLVAELGERVVGYLRLAQPVLQPSGAHVRQIQGLAVAPDSRGRGVGTGLVRFALDWAKRRGYAGMQFNAVVETNERAVRLWESLGFTILATVPEAFDHPVHGLVGLHVMHRAL